MKRIISVTPALAAALLALTSIAPAQVPSQMHYQGYLSDSEGPLDTTLSMTFTIYDDSLGSNIIWTEIQPSIVISEGLFNVLLGSVVPVTDSIFLESVRWLGIAVEPDPEIVPRTKLVTVPYAFTVSTLDGASGGEILGDVQLHSTLAVGEYGGDAGRIEVTDGNTPFVVADGAGRDLAITGKLQVASSSGGVGSNWNTGVQASATGSATNVGVHGHAHGGGESYGVWGHAAGKNWDTHYGIYGSTGSPCAGWAGYFAGQVRVTGLVVKGGGGFQIDHPLDPEKKYLHHSFVESPDMKNVYDGAVTLDAGGEAVVELPDYFETVNMDFRYQLTCVGGFAPVYVAQEISGNRFAIAGGRPGLKVCWQVTGVRRDPFAEANRIQVEVDKPPEAVGKYLHPEAYGLGEEYGIDYERHKRMQQALQKKDDQRTDPE
jgi:hypothetical protein